MASTEVESMMADIAPASLADARILDEVMNDGDEEAMRQLEIDIHQEVCMIFLHSCFMLLIFSTRLPRCRLLDRAHICNQDHVFLLAAGTRT